MNYEIAFAQMCLHTDYLTYENTFVRPGSHNYGGLTANYDSGVAASFPNEAAGVRAHIQHLKGYATSEPPRGRIEDRRYGLIKHGSSPTLEGLSGRWSPRTDYAPRVAAILRGLRGDRGWGERYLGSGGESMNGVREAKSPKAPDQVWLSDDKSPDSTKLINKTGDVLSVDVIPFKSPSELLPVEGILVRISFRDTSTREYLFQDEQPDADNAQAMRYETVRILNSEARNGGEKGAGAIEEYADKTVYRVFRKSGADTDILRLVILK